METETNAFDPSAALKELRRAEVLTHTRYPRLGAWYPPTAGGVAALYCAAVSGPDWLVVVAAIGLALGVGIAIGVYQRRRGVTPNPHEAPSQIKREMQMFGLAWLVLATGIAALFFVASWWLISLVAFVTVTALVAVYERRYALAAASAEAELEPERT